MEGGGMRASANGSGEIDSVELSVPLLGCFIFAGGCPFCDSCVSKDGSSMSRDISSAETFALEGCFLRVCGLIPGDCRTARVGFLAGPVGFLLVFLALADGAFGVADKSMFKSIGEVVTAVSELGALV